MAGRLAIRRLRLSGLAPRDHPAPDALASRMADAARAGLGEALADALGDWSGPAVLRIRRLDVDLTLDAAFDPDEFAAVLARAIVRALRRAGEIGDAAGEVDGVVAYPTRAAYLGALIEALAAGRAAQSWWLRDADGLRFLSPGAAIRTALLADAAVGLETLLALQPIRLAVILAALGEVEAARVLDGLAVAASGGVVADARGAAVVAAEACVAALVAAAAEPEADPSPLGLYLRAVARDPSAGGALLAGLARLWVRMADLLARQSSAAGAALLAALERGEDDETGTLAALPAAARRGLAQGLAQRRGRVASATAARDGPVCVLTRFGGLLLLLPTLGMDAIEDAVAEWPDAPPETAGLIGYAALGLCAGRERFDAWLREPVWRELFGLGPRTTLADIVDLLGGITEAEWATLAEIGTRPNTARDARFLLAPRDLVGSRAAAHTLACLARGASAGFARRLAGFGAASAPFLWDRLLGAGAILERRPGVWEARLSRPSLDVLLSLSRIAEGIVRFPSGVQMRLARVAA